MPSMLKWLYQPVTEENEPDVVPIEQRVYAGDMVIVNGEHGNRLPHQLPHQLPHRLPHLDARTGMLGQHKGGVRTAQQ